MHISVNVNICDFQFCTFNFPSHVAFRSTDHMSMSRCRCHGLEAGLARSSTRTLGNAAPLSKLRRSLISTLCFDQADDQCWRSAGSSQFARVVRGVDLRSPCTQLRMGSNPVADISGWCHSVTKQCFTLSSSNRVCLNVRPLLVASSCPASGLVLSKGGAQATLALLCSALRGGAPARCLATHKCHKCPLAV